LYPRLYDGVTMNQSKEICEAFNLEYTNQKYIEFENIDHMIKLCAPEDLSEKELKFFKKWFRKFGYNTGFNSNYYLFAVNQTKSKHRFRDNLYQLRSNIMSYELKHDYLKWRYPDLQHKDAVKADTARRFDLSTEYLLDELKLMGTDKTKTGELRTQIKTAAGLLEKCIFVYDTSLESSFKRYFQLAAKYEIIENDKVQQAIQLFNKRIQNPSSIVLNLIKKISG
jgi:hypothetical protein